MAKTGNLLIHMEANFDGWRGLFCKLLHLAALLKLITFDRAAELIVKCCITFRHEVVPVEAGGQP